MRFITKTLSVVLLGLSIAVPSFAAEATEVSEGESATYVKPGKVYTGKVAKGFTLGLSKDLSSQWKMDGDSADADQVLGLSLGYSDINVASIGYSTRFYVNIFEDSNYALRADINGTYGFTDQFYSFAGLNVQYLVLSGMPSEIDVLPNLGFQIGAGYQISESFALQAAFGQGRTTFKSGFSTATLTNQSLELGVVGVF